MVELEHAVRARRSIRLFHRDKPVPRELVIEALELAIRAPSHSNTQPWHVVLASGAARERLIANLMKEARTREPDIPPLPAVFDAVRFDLGVQLYGSLGIARSDTDGRRKARLRNWQFYDAPLAGIVCMHRELHHVDALGVGMFLQTFLLALTERGLGSCVQMLIAGFPDAVQETLNIPAQYEILCGLAIGYPVADFLVNDLNIGRIPLGQNVVFLGHRAWPRAYGAPGAVVRQGHTASRRRGRPRIVGHRPQSVREGILDHRLSRPGGSPIIRPV
jgi:nitroreductase